MTNIVPFTYNDTDVRTVVIDGEPWFVLADLCRVLDLAAVGRVAARLDEGVRQTHTLPTAGGLQQMTIVSEAGMYEVVIRSDKPEAAAFRRWITGTVLPQIRKTGTYGVKELSGPELLARAVIEAQSMITAQAEQIAELAPKAAAADTWLDADNGDRLVGQAAKILGMRERDLRRFLLDEKLLFTRHAPCTAVVYEPYAEYAGSHFTTREKIFDHTWGQCSHLTTRLTPRGMELVRRRMVRAGLLVVAS